MSISSDYSPEDWAALQEALLLAPLLVAAVSPQGRIGAAKESAALSAALSSLLQAGAGYDLLDNLRRDLALAVESGAFSQKFGEPDEARLRSLASGRLRQAAAALARSATPAESDYYRRGLLWVCWQVAGAAKEDGGFLGRGAVLVTENERSAIRQAAFALGLSAEQADDAQAGLPPPPPRRTPRLLAENFSLEEWLQVERAPLWVGLAVLHVDPSGVIGTARELAAMAAYLQQLTASFDGSLLMAELSSDLSLGIQDALAPAMEAYDRQRLIGRLDEFMPLAAVEAAAALKLVTERLGAEEGERYRRMLLDLARHTAEAAKEGGVFGIGAVRVSDLEQAFIDRLAEVLGGESQPPAV